MRTTHDFVIAANRLPVARSDDGNEWKLSPGGLVTAMATVMDRRNGAWVGWSGDIGQPAPDPFVYHDMALYPVEISESDYSGFYEGFSNATLWPLYHNALIPTTFKRSWWRAYQHVNERFAKTAIDALAIGGTLWIHDYHLQLVAGIVRNARPDIQIGFFLHTSFPPYTTDDAAPLAKRPVCRGSRCRPCGVPNRN